MEEIQSFSASFWYFGHPEVYIIILPAFGLISHVISASSGSVLDTKVWFCTDQHRNRWFCVWAHHMFIIGMSIETRTYFPVPRWWSLYLPQSRFFMTGIDHQFKAFDSVLWLFNAFDYVLIGGLTGLILANSALDHSFHDTYYVVAHFHYVLSLGAVFAAVLYQIFQSDPFRHYAHRDSFLSALTILFQEQIHYSFSAFHGLPGPTEASFTYPENYSYLNLLSNAGILWLFCTQAHFDECMRRSVLNFQTKWTVFAQWCQLFTRMTDFARIYRHDTESYGYSLATSHIFSANFSIFWLVFSHLLCELPGRPPSGDSLTFIFSDDDQHHH